jgi:trans-2,3-dihydro-3-hydroxyanthranilate isomerase
MAEHELKFDIVDVFSESRFSGNQLAVVRNGRGLDRLRMQKIAREFNFSETTFIIKDEAKVGEPFCVRIFTPKNELPFAGHPTLGTAWVIQQHLIGKMVRRVTLRLGVGDIPVTFQYTQKGTPDILWMKQGEPEFGKRSFDRGSFSRMLGIASEEIDPEFPIQEVSTGVFFIIVPLKTLESLKRCDVDRKRYFSLIKGTKAKSILVFCPKPYRKESDLAVRVFAEYYGVREDAATGSGNGCLAAYLSKNKYLGRSSVDATVDQGYEINRPSKIHARAVSSNGRIRVFIGGRVTSVAEGRLLV